MRTQNTNNKPEIAVFDIDGTLLPGITILDFPAFLAQSDLFSTASLDTIKKAKQDYSDKKVDYNNFIDTVVTEYAKGLEGKDFDVIQKEVDAYWKGNTEKEVAAKLNSVYPFLKPFLEKLHQGGGKAIVLSGSERNSLKPFLESFDFDEINTTDVGIIDGVYDGKVIFNAANLNNKKKKVAEILAKYPKADYFYYGFGDSAADLSFLEEVDVPIVVGEHDAILQAKIKENENWTNITGPESTIDLPS